MWNIPPFFEPSLQAFAPEDPSLSDGQGGVFDFTLLSRGAVGESHLNTTVSDPATGVTSFSNSTYHRRGEVFGGDTLAAPSSFDVAPAADASAAPQSSHAGPNSMA